MPALAEREIKSTGHLPREIVGSQAFNLEYLPPIASRQSIRQDIISYLGEYRFEIPKYEYDLFYSKNDRGEVSVLSADGESMLDKSQRAIKERRLRGEPTHREANETLGLLGLEDQLKDACDGDTIFWASPPGPEEEGYGDYGFIYRGGIQEGTIRMAALRVENPTIEQYNRAMSILTATRFNFAHTDDFLKSPYIVSAGISDSYIEHILKQEFSYRPDDQKQREFESAIRILDPMINRAIFTIRNGSREDRLSTFYALENYAIELRDRRVTPLIESTSLSYIISSLSYKPPVARGSCGSTGHQSNMLFSGDSLANSVLTQDKYGSREFKCPACNMTNIRPENELIERCQHCGSNRVGCETGGGEEDAYQKAA